MKATAEATPVTLLLTNLRLLDLPVNPDLPINEETFSLGKNKSKAFEHIAYHIFDRYDPVESKSRFVGAWPIYEPAQSKNFRAAVVNWLNDLKKTGALHNAVIIRKSMFDECHGERYEELLLSLSTMALKKVIERDNSEEIGTSIAFRRALASQPHPEITNILNIAYQKSLRNTLQRRFVNKQKWFLASRRLEEQEQAVDERDQATAAARESRRALEANEKDIKSTWEKNWVGDQTVYRLLLPGKSDSPEQDLWSDLSFQRLLKTGSFGKPGSTNGSDSALQELEDALKSHEDRLSQWAEYTDRFLVERSGSKKLSSVKKVSFAADVGGGLGVGFNKHQNLHASAFTLQEGTQLPIPSTEDEFGKLFDSMRKELQTIRVSRRKLGTLSYANTYGESGEEEEEEEVEVPQESKQQASKHITEEEALSLLTSHLPVDNTAPKQSPEFPIDQIHPPRIPTPPLPEIEVKPSPKPRLRSPPPPPKRPELNDDPEDSPEDVTSQDSPSVESPGELLRVRPSETLERGRSRNSYEGDDSVDEYMVEKLVAQIATTADTPAPARPQRILPNPTWSREELEEDPFKPRPKVALSPLLSPYQFLGSNDETSGTPKMYNSTPYDDGEDDFDEDDEDSLSPSKGRGSRYR
ncbi:hypothetical protein H072_7182 [Dactylellina haptotyla CBS 200.50]|uniref:HAUS augmin-like complex subunit 6 N-terminal domain-containing protein n=1 Tax=Dactylellina haptotyla (strain CBS 200.50) TaxID=1284197 RepID=S8A865_DACHA|nr:hypothetical protein H072_7182 [Dactylellina haptotyla CBS 200.50]